MNLANHRATDPYGPVVSDLRQALVSRGDSILQAVVSRLLSLSQIHRRPKIA